MLPLHIALCSTDATPGGATLARVAYALEAEATTTVALRPLSGPRLEIWTTESAVATYEQPLLTARYTDQALVMTAGAPLGSEASFESDITRVYREILSTLETLSFPHILRMWNYIPHITAPSLDIDFYRRFNRARAAAFGTRSQWPAATAVGTDRGGFFIYLLASRTPGVALENPRQVSAFRYPEQYGPKSPLFARAVLKQWTPALTHVYISGTASVLGHESRHSGDVLAQVDEALENLAAVLTRAAVIAGVPMALTDLTAVKVYVADPAHTSIVRERLRLRLRNQEPLLLRADLCRRELLVEIEAIAVVVTPHGHPPGAGGSADAGM